MQLVCAARKSTAALQRPSSLLLFSYVQSGLCLTWCDRTCRQMFCGKDALDELAVGALVARTKELTEAPQLRSSQPKKSDEVDDAQDSTLLDTEKAANPPQSNGHEPGTASKPGRLKYGRRCRLMISILDRYPLDEV